MLRACEVVDVTHQIRKVASAIKPTSIRSLDAIHVATALVCKLSAFATFDLRQQVAAEEADLEVEQP